MRKLAAVGRGWRKYSRFVSSAEDLAVLDEDSDAIRDAASSHQVVADLVVR